MTKLILFFFIVICNFFIYFRSTNFSNIKAQTDSGDVSLVEPTVGWEESSENEGVVPSITVEPTVVQDDVVQEDKEDFYNWQFKELKQKYINELENYRRLLKEYEIAKDQYYRHTTLKSLDVTVNKTKELMATRCRVLLNYFEMLSIKLNLSKGLSDKLFELYETKIDEKIFVIEDHQNQVETITTRAQANQLSRQYEDIQETSQALAYTFLINLSFSKFQYGLDNLSEYYYELKDDKPEIKNPNKKAEFSRAHQETERYLESTREKYSLEWENIQFSLIKSNRSHSYYNSLSKNLSINYNKLFKIHGYLKELVEYDD